MVMILKSLVTTRILRVAGGPGPGRQPLQSASETPGSPAPGPPGFKFESLKPARPAAAGSAGGGPPGAWRHIMNTADTTPRVGDVATVQVQELELRFSEI
jgi:hypothetical protein